MRTKTIGYIEPQELESVVHDCLCRLSTMRGEEGFSFAVSLRCMEEHFRMAKEHAAQWKYDCAYLPGLEKLVEEMKSQDFDLLLICNDDSLRIK